MTDDYEVQAYTYSGKSNTRIFMRADYARVGYADNFAQDAAAKYAHEIMRLGFVAVGHENDWTNTVWERVDRVVMRQRKTT